MFMSQRRTLIALCAVALSAVLLLPDVSSAQLFGRGGRAFGGIGNYGGWGGNYGGYGWGNPYYGGYGSAPGYWSSPYYGGTWGGNYVMPGYTYGNPQPYNYSSPIFSGTNFGNTAVSSQSAYPPDGRSQMSMDRTRALINVHVPPDAQVFFDNSPTQQRGAERRFVTPQLDPNSRYSYNISAQWMENGRERRESRTVRLTPGQTAEVNFLNPQNTDGVQQNQGQQQQPRQGQQQPPRKTQPPTTPPDR